MDLADYCNAYNRVAKLAADNKWCAIHANLLDMYRAMVMMRPIPYVFVDLGVRSTEAFSSRVMLEVAELVAGNVYACDIADCSNAIDAINNPRWHFHQGDAAEYASKFTGHADVLCIDTTEKYEDTLGILTAWAPRMSDQSLTMLRCSNLGTSLAYENGERTGLGWDNARGVSLAIERFYGINLNEHQPSHSLVRRQHESLYITHYPWGGGLTMVGRFLE